MQERHCEGCKITFLSVREGHPSRSSGGDATKVYGELRLSREREGGRKEIDYDDQATARDAFLPRALNDES